MDHFFPKSQFAAALLKSKGFSEEEVADLREMMNSLPNLQLLAGVENQEKRSKLPTEWLSTFESDEKRTEYLNLHLLGNVPDDLLGFKSFHSARRESLKSEITTLLT